MNLSIDRPSVKEMMFSLYARPLHPELFDVLACRRITRDDWTLAVCITPAGHLLAWSNWKVFLTETVATAEHQLPRVGKLLRHRFEGERRGFIKPIAGIHYQMSSQIEVLTPRNFARVHEDILADGSKRGLLHRHSQQDRFGLSPLGFITVESWRTTLSINAFHTFPSDRAVVKTQSLIEYVR